MSLKAAFQQKEDSPDTPYENIITSMIPLKQAFPLAKKDLECLKIVMENNRFDRQIKYM